MAKVTGTRNAFAQMITERAVYKKLGVERSTVSGWKNYLRQGNSISVDKMEEMLVKGGAKLLREAEWDI